MTAKPTPTPLACAWVVASLLAVALALPAGAADDRRASAHGDSNHASRSTSSVPSALGPSALAPTPDQLGLLVACAEAGQVVCVDLATDSVQSRIPVPPSPTGLAVTPDGSRVWVTSAAPHSTLSEIRLPDGEVLSSIPAGHTATAPVISPDGRTLYVCERFDDRVLVLDLNSRRAVHRIPVSREPVAAALTRDGHFLLVVNHLHAGRADGGTIGAVVSVIDTERAVVDREIRLPRGASLAREIAVSPDGRFASVTHLLARYYLPTEDVTFGAINSNAISILDLAELKWIRLAYLDQAGLGAANPWGIVWPERTNATVAVALSGTHEVALVDAPLLPRKPLRTRVRLPVTGRGPRALAVAGTRLFTANYFSDDLSVIDLAKRPPQARRISLTESAPPSLAREGEAWFNDATLCRQQWQSCASCHDTDARTDAMNWDLLNDGRGNPKNVRSLLGAHQTPPAMALGVRTNAAAAIRAGLRHILFAEVDERIATTIDAFVASLRPVPSPHLQAGRLSPAADRGRNLFNSRVLGCVACHPPPLFTDGRRHDVGSRNDQDQPDDPFDTPSLVELWRTAPYLHDGSAATIRDLLEQRRRQDRHGNLSHLSPAELADLEAYLLSL